MQLNCDLSQGGIGINVAQMIVELMRDKRKLVDRITKHHIDRFIDLLGETQVCYRTVFPRVHDIITLVIVLFEILLYLVMYRSLYKDTQCFWLINH